MTSTRISRLIPAVAIALVLAACGGAAVDSGNGDAGAADHVTSDADHAEDGHAERRWKDWLQFLEQAFDRAEEIIDDDH